MGALATGLLVLDKMRPSKKLASDVRIRRANKPGASKN